MDQNHQAAPKGGCVRQFFGEVIFLTRVKSFHVLNLGVTKRSIKLSLYDPPPQAISAAIPT